jgi:cardiolipin synthase
MMSITANQVTLLRLVLLPIPCFLLFGNPWEKFLALLFFVLIGLTDYLDGYLARKHGPTTLGALIDPMADKIFVTAMYIPLARLEVVPIWMVLLLFIREYTVTELRSIHGSGGQRFSTSELAKYKTTIQMMGGGVLILFDIFRSSQLVFIPLGILFSFAVSVAIWTYRKQGRLGLRSFTFVTLAASVCMMRLLLPYETTTLIVMVIVVVMTLASGLQYLLETWRQMGGYLRERFGTKEWASFVGISLAFPVIYVSTLYSREVAVWMVIGILSLEFATGGLTNFLTTLRKSSSYMPQTIKILFVNGAGLVGLMLTLFSAPTPARALNTLMLVVLAVSLVYCVRYFYIHRRSIMTGKTVST